MGIRLGVIGAGYLGRHHARIYSGLEGVELVFVSDIDEAVAGAVAGQCGSTSCTDYRSMLGRVDAVSIVTPTTLHHDVALECLRAGLDVLVEKPVTVTVSEADELVEEAAKRGAIIQVGHLERYNPSVAALMDMVKKPLFIEAERVSPYLGRASDVDVTLDLMIHDIDIVFGLVGDRKVLELRAAGMSVITSRIDAASAWMEFEGGITARLTSSRVAGEKRRLLAVREPDAAYELDYQRATITRHIRENNVKPESIIVEQREPLREELIDFVDCIKTRRRPKVSGEDGRRALSFAIAVTEKIAASRR